jgi:hypothetical protein
MLSKAFLRRWGSIPISSVGICRGLADPEAIPLTRLRSSQAIGWSGSLRERNPGKSWIPIT